MPEQDELDIAAPHARDGLIGKRSRSGGGRGGQSDIEVRWKRRSVAEASEQVARTHRCADRAGTARCGARSRCVPDRCRRSAARAHRCRPGENFALRSGNETRAPETGCRGRRRVPASKPVRLHASKRQAVGDGVSTLHGDPGIALAILFVLRIVSDPSRSRSDRAADRRRRAPSGAPLPDTTDPSRPARRACRPRSNRFEAEIAGREVELLVKRRIVRDVHLAVLAGDRAPSDRTRPRCCDRCPAARSLEQRGDHDEASSSSASAPMRSVLGPGIGSARSNSSTAFVLAEIRSVVQLLQQHQVARRRAAASRRPSSMASRLASRLPRSVSCSSATFESAWCHRAYCVLPQAGLPAACRRSGRTYRLVVPMRSLEGACSDAGFRTWHGPSRPARRPAPASSGNARCRSARSAGVHRSVRLVFADEPPR